MLSESSRDYSKSTNYLLIQKNRLEKFDISPKNFKKRANLLNVLFVFTSSAPIPYNLKIPTVKLIPMSQLNLEVKKYPKKIITFQMILIRILVHSSK